MANQNEVPIPAGWRLLQPGDILKRGDKYFQLRSQEWETTTRVNEEVPPAVLYIRRKERAKRKSRKETRIKILHNDIGLKVFDLSLEDIRLMQSYNNQSPHYEIDIGRGMSLIVENP